MVHSLAYRRPPQVSTSSSTSLTDDEMTRSINESIISSKSSCVSHGIPAALSFDRIVSGGTCPVQSFQSVVLSAADPPSYSLALSGTS